MVSRVVSRKVADFCSAEFSKQSSQKLTAPDGGGGGVPPHMDCSVAVIVLVWWVLADWAGVMMLWSCARKVVGGEIERGRSA